MGQRITYTRTIQETQCQARSFLHVKRTFPPASKHCNVITQFSVTETSSLSEQHVAFIDHETLKECLPMAETHVQVPTNRFCNGETYSQKIKRIQVPAENIYQKDIAPSTIGVSTWAHTISTHTKKDTFQMIS